MSIKCAFLALILSLSSHMFAQSSVRQALKNKSLVALWDFKEEAGQSRKSLKGDFALTEINGNIPRIEDGPLSGYSALFGNEAYLALANAKTSDLNIFGPGQGVTVVAWVKWTGEQTGFVGGMWNEYQDGGKRQYGLFVSLPHYNGKNQVCGHISTTGKPTPPFPYSIDYSASAQEVPANTWACIYRTRGRIDPKYQGFCGISRRINSIKKSLLFSIWNGKQWLGLYGGRRSIEEGNGQLF
jgi:hypothetical protein